MTIIDFYKELSKLLKDTREDFITKSKAESELEDLLEEAKKSGLDVKIDPNILDPVNLMRLDDEKSFRSDDDDYGNSDFSYGDSDTDFSY
jgi:hypothetical protein